MGLLDPKPQTQAGLDAAVTAKINQVGSATQVALSATYRNRAVESIADKYAPRRPRPKVAVLTVPPTLGVGTTNGGSSANTALTGSTLLSYTSSKITYVGGIMDPSSGNPGWYGQPRPVVGANPRLIAACFGFEGQKFEWRTNGTGNNYRIWVNGQPATSGWSTLPLDGLDHLMTVDMGSRDFWDIRIEMHNCYFGGIRVLQTDQAYPTLALSPLRIAIVGDSFTDGQSYNAGAATYTPGYVFRLAELLQVEDVWGRARGGTGMLTANSFRSRLATDVIPFNPDVILIPGSVNDTNSTPAVGAIATEIQAIYDQIKAALPNCLIVGASVLSLYTNGNVDMVNTDMKAKWAALGVPYIDLVPLNTGTGMVGTNRTVTDAVLNSTTTVTSATAAFVSGDVGRIVAATGIPAGATIASVTNGTTAVLSVAATASATGVTLALTNQRGDGTADFHRSTDGVHPAYPEGFDHIAYRLAVTLGPILRTAR